VTSFSFLPIYVCGGLAAAGALASGGLAIATIVLVARGAASAGSAAIATLVLFLRTTMMAAFTAVCA
jgi:hypothetical protein